MLYKLMGYQDQYLIIMKGLVQKNQDVSDTDSVASNSSFIMSQKDLQRSKRKKRAAFQSFLVMPQPQEDSIPRKRKLSNHEMQQQTLQVPNNCKICNQILRDKVKVCDFCKDTLCITHFRKARLNMNTKKFSRICDYCDDKKLMEKHFQNLIISQENIISQELVSQQKYNRVKLQFEGKKIKLKMLKDKQKDLQQLRKAKQNSIIRSQRQFERQWKQVLRRIEQNNKFQQKLSKMQTHLPHSQQKDFKIMQKQKDKVIKAFNKISRQCESLVKIKSSVERKMYEDLYQWQLIQKYKMKQDKKKEKDQCNIY